MSNNRIYVAIASYRDPLLNSTINSLYANADNPDNISVGCYVQSYENDWSVETPGNRFPNKHVFAQVDSPGTVFSVTECRRRAFEFFTDEAYVLQIDSHTRFQKGWDSILLNYIKDLPEKSALSTYLPGWRPLPTGEEFIAVNEGFFEPTFTEMSKQRLIEGTIVPENVNIEDGDNKLLYKSWYLAAHFIFAKVELFKCINQQDWIMFWGEEFINSLAAASEDWNVYLPYNTPLAHMYPQDVEAYIKLNKIFKDFPDEWNKKSHQTTKIILNMLNNVIERQGFTQKGLDKINAHIGYDLVEQFNDFLKDS
jgi:hypothetical protein